MKLYLRYFSRIIVGLTFIMSGFVKGVDPLGTMYRVVDYFIAYETMWAEPLAFTLTMLLVVTEFSLGVMILLNLWPKLSGLLIALMMGFFTIVTGYDAIELKVPDCGCFGDFIILSPLNTFLKNIVLDVFVVIILVTNKLSKPVWTKIQQYVWSVLIIVGFTGFSFHSVNHLPSVDFRYWKVGTDINLASSSEDIYYLVYKNKESGEKQTYLSEELPWEDSIWMSEWEFAEQLIDSDEATEPHDLQIIDEYGEDVTNIVLLNSEYQFVVCAYDINTTDKDALKSIINTYEKLKQEPYSWMLLSGSFEEEIDMVYEELGGSLIYGEADEIVVKTMVRANPGIMLIKNGIILEKWHHNDFPSAEIILEKYSDFIE